MSKLQSERVETLRYDGTDYDIVGCFSSDDPPDTYTHFDVFIASTGECINEGCPFYERPTAVALAAWLADQGFA